MMTSDVRPAQLESVNSIQTEAVAHERSCALPRKVNLQAGSKPAIRLVKPKASAVCPSETSAAEPAMFQLERLSPHLLETLARSFSPKQTTAHTRQRTRFS